MPISFSHKNIEAKIIVCNDTEAEIVITFLVRGVRVTGNLI